MFNSTRNHRFSLTITDFPHDFQVLSFKGDECISQPYAFEVELVSERPLKHLNELMHKQAFLGFDSVGNGIHGQVHRASRGTASKRLTRYNVTLVPQLALLKHRINQRIFQSLSVPQIITQVLQEHGLHSVFHRFDLGSTYPAREYCVQFLESDLHFIQRLCEEEGIHYHFRHSREKHLLVFGDDQTVFPRLIGVTAFKQENALVAEEPVISHFVEQLVAGTTRTTRRGYDFSKARIVQESNGRLAAQYGAPDLEDYGAASRFTGAARGKMISQRALERHRASYRRAEGKSDQPGLIAGHFLHLSEHPDPDFNDLWLLTHVHHEGLQPAVLEEETSYVGIGQDDDFTQGYRNAFVATPWDVIYRSPLTCEKPRVAGSQTATVTGPKGEEIHCNEHGQVKVQFHWDRLGNNDDKSSCWLRVATAWAGESHGSVCLPRVGMEVLVTFLDGDPDQPLINMCLVNSLNPPPYELPQHRTRSVFRSRSSPDSGGFNELHLEDRAGSELIYVRAQRDMEQKIENNSRLEVGNERRETIKGNSISLLEAEEQRTVRADRKVHVVGNNHNRVDQNLVIQAGRNIYINAADHLILEAGISVSIKAGGQHTVYSAAGIFSSSDTQPGGTPMPGLAASLPGVVDALVAPVLPPPVFAPGQDSLMATSAVLGADFCPVCEACREGFCQTPGASA